jgi:hypothetical protein
MIVAFLLTGQYMDKAYAHLHGMAMGPRLLYRTRHIYVLMAALINVALSAYVIRASRRQRRVVQLAGSVFIAGGSVLLAVAFFYDAPHIDLAPLNLVYSRAGIYSLAVGTLLHALGGAREESGSRRDSQPQSPAG